MSLYNMVNGVDPATFFILPMLGKHPGTYPRFRDCFTEERSFQLTSEGFPVMMPTGNAQGEPWPGIFVCTRVGGGNRDDVYAEY